MENGGALKTSDKRIEKRFNTWLYVAALYLSIVAGSFFENEMTVYSLISQLNLIFGSVYGSMPFYFSVVLRLLIPLAYVGVFELVSRLFYVISNSVSFGAVNMKMGEFVSVLRVFTIFLNFALGILNLLYYLFNFLIPLGMIVLSFVIASSAYFLFFAYLNKYYLDPKTAHRAFRSMAVIYLIFSFLNIAGGALI